MLQEWVAGGRGRNTGSKMTFIHTVLISQHCVKHSVMDGFEYVSYYIELGGSLKLLYL